MRAAKVRTDAQIVRRAVASMLLFTAFGGFCIYKSLESRSNGEPLDHGSTAYGVVAKVLEGTSLKGRTTYRAETTFTDSQGKTHTVLGHEGGRTNRPHVGDRVKVSYDPTNPDNARDLSTYAGSWKVVLWAGVALIVLGCGVSLAFEIYPMLRARRSRTAARL